MSKETGSSLKELSLYLEGLSDGHQIYRDHNVASQLRRGSKAVGEYSRMICAGGFVCKGGDNCTSDHK